MTSRAITSANIPRHLHDPDGLDFASLRGDAIAAVQDLAGNLWTDFNAHDPGVTIIEQLCYGLTELAFQMRAPMVDQLADARGRIDLNAYSLFAPQHILTTRPVTPQDYAKALLDRVPEIEDIEVIPSAAPDGGAAPLYQIHLKLFEPLVGVPTDADQQRSVCKEVRRCFLSLRNLGEDLHSITLQAATPCYLKGMIEVSTQRPLATIYAEVFFQTARFLSSQVQIRRYDSLDAATIDLARLFEGPFTQHGYIHGDRLADGKLSQDPGELGALLSTITGVRKVHHVALVDEQGQVIQPRGDTRYALQFPTELHQQRWLTIDFSMSHSGDPHDVLEAGDEQLQRLMAETRRAIQKLEFEYRAFRSGEPDISNIFQPPEGRPKQPLHYHSIQHHFPDTYGINAAGIPPRASAERADQARQLKAYLYPMEQLMANLQAQIQQAHQLFRHDGEMERSYFCQWLDNHNLPNLETLYLQPKPDLKKIQEIQASHDPALERRSRALDTLLALYGEAFPQDALLRFNAYHKEFPEHWVIANKTRLLKHLVLTSGARAGAADFSQPLWGHNLGGFHTRLNILLGIEHLTLGAPLSHCLRRNRAHWLDDSVWYRRSKHGRLSQNHGRPVPRLSLQRLKRVREAVKRTSLAVCPSLLRSGTHLSSYRLVARRGCTEVYFCPGGHGKARLVGVFAKPVDAVYHAHRLQQKVIQINIDGEGFYMLEHLLLRPRGDAPELAEWNEFFHARVSLILPNWTARFRNSGFRHWVERTVAEQMPAHLFPHIYWLSLPEMQKFESCYLPWREALQKWQQDSGANTQALDRASLKLRLWLQEYSAGQGGKP